MSRAALRISGAIRERNAIVPVPRLTQVSRMGVYLVVQLPCVAMPSTRIERGSQPKYMSSELIR